MKFTKTNIDTPKGRQPTKYDWLLNEFENPGDSLQFEEKSKDNPEGMARQTASNIAKRLMKLAPDKQFHSFFDVTEQKVTIRWRKDTDIIKKNGDDDEVEDESEEIEKDINPTLDRQQEENDNDLWEVK